MELALVVTIPFNKGGKGYMSGDKLCDMVDTYE